MARAKSTRITFAVAGVLAATALVLLGMSLIGDEGKPKSVRRAPAGIATDCSRPATAQLQALIDATPNGSMIEFAHDGCYLLYDELQVNDRTDLTFEGRGSTFKLALPRQDDHCHSNWRIQAGSNIHFRNMTAEGMHTTTFADPRPSAMEQCQHGWSIDSLQGGTFVNLRGINNNGDPISLEPDRRKGGDYCAVPPNRDIVIDNFYGVNAGRTVAITNGDGVVIKNSRFDQIYDNVIDIETDTHCEWSRNIKILDNRFGVSHFAAIAYTGSEPPERSGNLEIARNVMEQDPVSCFPPIYIEPAGYAEGQYRHNIQIRDNVLRTLGHGIYASRIGSSSITNNRVIKNYGTGCATEQTGGLVYAVRLLTAHDVQVAGNVAETGPNGLPLDGELTFDATSTGVNQGAAPVRPSN